MKADAASVAEACRRGTRPRLDNCIGGKWGLGISDRYLSLECSLEPHSRVSFGCKWFSGQCWIPLSSRACRKMREIMPFFRMKIPLKDSEKWLIKLNYSCRSISQGARRKFLSLAFCAVANNLMRDLQNFCLGLDWNISHSLEWNEGKSC